MLEINNILHDKEKIVWEAKPHFGNYFTLVSLFGIISLIFLLTGFLGRQSNDQIFSGLSIYSLILGFIFLAVTVIRILQYRLLAYALTNHRAIIQYGIIGTDYKSIDFDKIQEINVEVDLLGKIFKTGNIQFKTAGVNVVQTKYGQTVAPSANVMGYIKNPYEVSKKLREISHTKIKGK